MLDTHIREPGEAAKEPAADETEQGPDIHLALLLRQPNSQLLITGVMFVFMLVMDSNRYKRKAGALKLVL